MSKQQTFIDELWFNFIYAVAMAAILLGAAIVTLVI